LGCTFQRAFCLIALERRATLFSRLCVCERARTQSDSQRWVCESAVLMRKRTESARSSHEHRTLSALSHECNALHLSCTSSHTHTHTPLGKWTRALPPRGCTGLAVSSSSCSCPRSRACGTRKIASAYTHTLSLSFSLSLSNVNSKSHLQDVSAGRKRPLDQAPLNATP
jgi:hypothetical protein